MLEKANSVLFALQVAVYFCLPQFPWNCPPWWGNQSHKKVFQLSTDGVGKRRDLILSHLDVNREIEHTPREENHKSSSKVLLHPGGSIPCFDSLSVDNQFKTKRPTGHLRKNYTSILVNCEYQAKTFVDPPSHRTNVVGGHNVFSRKRL